ncbi:MAG: hypothetical protein EOO92_17900 [Pedobacter sp.]|nr:MAG: hypothetical protein EOO92_17900 [Pedobacter sp.]
MQNSYLRTSIVLLSCFLITSTAALAQGFNLEGRKKRTTIPFQLVRNMIVIKLKINDRGPYNFILDTGVGMMVITEPSMVDSLIAPSYRKLNLYGLGDGQSLEAYVAPSIKVDVKGVKNKGMAAAILAKDHFGLSNYAGMDIHGLLGYQFFHDLSVKINFLDSALVVTKPKDMRKMSGSQQIPITIENFRPYIYSDLELPDGTKKNSKLLVDIGAGHSLLLENNEAPVKRYISKANLGMGFNGPISGFMSRIGKMQLGKYKFGDVITSFPDKDSIKTNIVRTSRDGNLGMGILKRFNILINYQAGVMMLKPSAKFKDPFEHDMSGIEYYAGGKDYKRIIINRIETKGNNACIL